MKNLKKSVVRYGIFVMLTLLIVAVGTGCAGGAIKGDIGFKSSYDVVIIGSGGAG